jgi:hypothetical protein
MQYTDKGKPACGTTPETEQYLTKIPVNLPHQEHTGSRIRGSTFGYMCSQRYLENIFQYVNRKKN